MIEDSFSDSRSSLPVNQSCPVLRVLVADQRVIADVFSMILNRSGFFAVPAYSGKRAGQLAAIMCPDVAMIELLLPGPGVIETCAAIRKYAPACRLLITTGYPRHAIFELLEVARAELGEFEVIHKPFKPGDAIALLGGPIPPEGLSNL